VGAILTEDLDASLRCATAVSCHVPEVMLELTLLDGRIAKVSHEPAFQPVMPPCALRAALVTSRRPQWCGLIHEVDLRGPFVEIDDSAQATITTFEHGATAVATFATTAPPCLLAVLMETARPPEIDTALIDGRLHVDPELGTVVVWMASDGLSARQLHDAALWVTPQVARL
jgi:hypothetical protein